MACPPGSDRSFGPRVNPACRSFDFTITFEDIVLVCLPASIFLLLAPFVLHAYVLTTPRTLPRPRLLASKLIALAGLFAANVAVLITRVERHEATSASLAAQILTLISILVAALVSTICHKRSRRPSTLLALYFSPALLLTIPRVRTFWLVSEDVSIAASLTVALVFNATVLLLESIEGRGAPIPTASKERKSSQGDQKSSFWNRTVFAWLAPTFWLGFTKILSQSDLPSLSAPLQSRSAHSTLDLKWSRYNRQGRHSLALACFRAFLPTFLSAVVPRLCLTAATFAQPYLLAEVIDYVAATNPKVDYGRGLIGAWALVFLGIAITTSVYKYQTARLVTKIRGALVTLVHHQSLRLKAFETGEITVVSLLGVDIERIESSLESVHEVWASLIEIGVATWLLEREISLACLAPVVLVIVFLAVTARIAPWANTAQQKWIEKVQQRVKITGHFLDNVNSVKLLGLSDAFASIIERARAVEIETSKGYRKVLVSILLLSNTPIVLAPTVTFSLYVIISVFWKGSSLEIAQAFKALVFISLLVWPVVVFTQALPNLIQSLGNFSRIQEYCTYDLQSRRAVDMLACNDDDTDTSKKDPGEQLRDYSRTGTASFGRTGEISFNTASFKWAPSGPIVLDQLKVSIESGKVTVVVGAVGSGKSSFLNSILGEMSGPVGKHHSRIAYCSQRPWLESKSIRDTIVGENEFDGQWYARVLWACDLEQDLAQLEAGDETNLSSRGVNLSGGQKQRVALARAVYSRSPITLLDDVFSGMDANTVDAVSQRLFAQGGVLRDPMLTVILTTNNKKVMSLADEAIVLEKGKITPTGSPVPILCVKENVIAASNSENDLPPPATENDSEGIKVEAEELDLKRKTGDLTVYKYYIRCSGYFAFASYMTFMTVWMFFTEFSTIWLMWWSDSNARSPNYRVGMYIGVYATFGILGTLSASLAAWFEFISMISKSGKHLHSDLLWATIKAPSWFFATTDAGEILNRFSQDMELIDMALPMVAGNFLSSAVSCLIKFIIIIVFSRYLSASIPVLGAVLYFLQKFYLQTSRQIRLLSIEAKAPLYSTFSETVAGASHIRAFGWEQPYKNRAYGLIDCSQEAKYALACVQHWLAFVLDMVTTAFVTVLVATIVTWRDKFQAGWVAVSLYMVVGFSATLTRVITNWTAMESSVGAVARVKNFVDSTPSERGGGRDARGRPHGELSLDPPRNGKIEFENVDASHQPSGALVLRQLTVSIAPGERIAICGRSGSGKSSLLLSVLGLTSLRSGAAAAATTGQRAGNIKIDDTPISTLDPRELRQRINCIPQDALVLPGTIRFNLDPSGTASEELVRRVVRSVGGGLESAIDAQGAVRGGCGLDAEVDAEAWSAGQRQLLSLARAILRRKTSSISSSGSGGGILMLDEATSNVDAETENLMHEVIMREFHGATVLAVMHRLDHVFDYDKVAVMSEGRLVEFGTPGDLVNRAESLFAALYASDVGGLESRSKGEAETSG